MPPTLILIRHAEALHNMTQDWSIPDPQLSQLGLQQCAQLRDHLRQSHDVRPLAERARLVVVSPMRRTLQTALLSLDWLIQGDEGVPVRLDAGWQENSDKPCDTGSPIPVISADFPDLDWSVVDPSYPEKQQPASNPYAFSRDAILRRGQTCLEWLYSRPEKVIIVVSHSGFLRCAVSNRRYANADYRIFDFAEKEHGKDYQLKEWELTESQGGGMGRSEKGVYGIVASDFPETRGQDQQLGEPTAELPN